MGVVICGMPWFLSAFIAFNVLILVACLGKDQQGCVFGSSRRAYLQGELIVLDDVVHRFVHIC